MRRYIDPKKAPLAVRVQARKLTKERWNREAAARRAKKAGPGVAMGLLRPWYIRYGEVGITAPRARLIDGSPIRLHVPDAQHTESTVWKLLGEHAANEPD